MIPKVFLKRTQTTTQTELSSFANDSQFDFTEDDLKKSNFALPKIDFDSGMVHGIIKPLFFAPNGAVVNHHIPRLYKRKNSTLIHSIKEQIDSNPQFKNEYIRQIAAALIPGLNDGKYRSLFSHPIPFAYKICENSKVSFDSNGNVQEECTAIFSLDGTLIIQTTNACVHCNIELWDKVLPGRVLNLIKDDRPFGKLTIIDQVDPISNDHVPKHILDYLGIESEDEIDCLIKADDTSFIDIVLSLPSLTSKDANDLLSILHSRRLLSPYLRSKVCSILLESDPCQQREWPELLGRFLFLLDRNWVFSNISYLRNNDVMAIFRHIKDLKGAALYVLQATFFALDEIRGSDPVIFFWTLLFLSHLQNASISNPQQSQMFKDKLIQMWRELQKKGPESHTRKMSLDTINYIKNIKQFQIGIVVHEEIDFIQSIFTNHTKEVLEIIDRIPYRVEESHPLYYPVVLAIETALMQARSNNDFLTSDSESMVSDYETMTSPNNSRSRHSHTNADLVSYDLSENQSLSSRRGYKISSQHHLSSNLNMKIDGIINSEYDLSEKLSNHSSNPIIHDSIDSHFSSQSFGSQKQYNSKNSHVSINQIPLESRGLNKSSASGRAGHSSYHHSNSINGESSGYYSIHDEYSSHNPPTNSKFPTQTQSSTKITDQIVDGDQEDYSYEYVDEN